MIRTIYILWFQGFNNAPPVVKMCVKSWKYYNKKWNIVLLDNNNIKKYIDINEIYSFIDKNKIGRAHV